MNEQVFKEMQFKVEVKRINKINYVFITKDFDGLVKRKYKFHRTGYG
jgi:hypothetical protein